MCFERDISLKRERHLSDVSYDQICQNFAFSPFSLLEPTRKPTERQQTLSLYRSDYRPQSGPSQPLQTTSLSLFLSSSPSSSFSLSLS